MGTWWIGCAAEPKENAKLLYDALDVMKTGDTIEADDVGRDVFIGFLKSKDRWKEGLCGFHATDSIFLDGGGMIMVDEPKISWEANGCKLETYVQQLPFAVDLLKQLLKKERDPNLPGVVGFRGFCRIYVMGEKTVTDAIAAAERLTKETEAQRKELERKNQEFMNTVSHSVSMRPCSCLSGKLYVECCGKGTEGEAHKQIRQGIQDQNRRAN